MKRRILTSIFIGVCTVNIHAQITFQTIVESSNGSGGVANAITRTNDDGYAVTGLYTPVLYSWNLYNVLVAKLNTAGNLQWITTIDGNNNYDVGFSIIQTNDGGYAVTGRASTDATFFQVFVIKLDSSGNVQWKKKFTSDPQQFEEGFSIIQTADNGYAVAGKTYESSGFPLVRHDVYVIKMDSVGSLQWTKYVPGFSFYIGETGHSIVQTSDHGYVIDGYTSSGAGGTDLYIVKLDSVGNTQWSRAVGGAGNEKTFEFSKSLTLTNDDGIAITGSTSSFGAGDTNVYVVKLNSAGNLQWTRTVGGPGVDRGYSIVQTTDHGYAISGATNSFGAGDYDMYLIKLDSAGSLQWTRAVGDSLEDYGHSIVQASDGGYTLAGSSQTLGAGDLNLYVVKFDSSGNTCGYFSADTSFSGSGGTLTIIPGASGSLTTTTTSLTWGPWSSSGSFLSVCLAGCLLPVAVISATDSTTICPGNSVTLTADTGTGQTYQWKKNGTNISSGILSFYTATTQGNYSCIVTNVCGSTTSNVISVALYSLPPATITAGSSTIFCQGDSVILTADSSGNYLWSTNSTTQSITVSTPGIYFVTVTDSNGCSATSASSTVTVNPLPTVNLSGLPDTVCMNTGAVTLTGIPPGGVFSGNGVLGNTFSPSVAGQGSHLITYSFTDSLGCSNGFGAVVFVDICLGLSNMNQNIFSVTIFPNPSGDHFSMKVKSTDHSRYLFILYDLAGRELERESHLAINEDFDFGKNLSAGFYFAEVVQGDNRKIIRLIKN